MLIQGALDELMLDAISVTSRLDYHPTITSESINQAL